MRINYITLHYIQIYNAPYTCQFASESGALKYDVTRFETSMMTGLVTGVINMSGGMIFYVGAKPRAWGAKKNRYC